MRDIGGRKKQERQLASNGPLSWCGREAEIHAASVDGDGVGTADRWLSGSAAMLHC